MGKKNKNGHKKGLSELEKAQNILKASHVMRAAKSKNGKREIIDDFVETEIY